MMKKTFILLITFLLTNALSVTAGCTNKMGENFCRKGALQRLNFEPPVSENSHSPLPVPEIPDANIVVFVSFSMPAHSLKTYFQDVTKAGGRLIMRGLKNKSFMETKKASENLQISFDIDPTLFEEFDVTVVPTFVKKGEKNSKKLEGHVTWKRVMEKLGDIQ